MELFHTGLKNDIFFKTNNKITSRASLSDNKRVHIYIDKIL